MTSNLTFEEDVAVVTGAGSGLGRRYALELASRGAAVVCNDIVEAAAVATVEEILQRGGRAVAEWTSVASPEGGAAIVQSALDSFGSVEIVINNAGQLRNAPFDEMTVDHFEEVIRTHLEGAFYVTQPAYRHMKAAGYGRIVFTSSSTGVFGAPWSANYAAAKTGLVGLSNVVALEGAAHGITSNVIMPTALGTGMGGEGPPYSAEYLEEMLRAFQPFAGHTSVDNVAPLVVYLVHRACNLTQQIFSVGFGHVGRVFVGASRGWYAPDLTCSTPEEVAANLAVASDPVGFGIPHSATEELRFISENLPE
jgi:NAD(P)-dependent dehydrogenase (short-subunit alcohol dehydrogenase family)